MSAPGAPRRIATGALRALGGGLTVVGIAIYLGGGSIGRAKRERACQGIRAIRGALDQYRQAHGTYPPDLKALAPQAPDPWGRAYAYRLEGGRAVVSSLGRDGEPGGDGPDADIAMEWTAGQAQVSGECQLTGAARTEDGGPT